MPTQEEVEGGALLLVEAIASAGPHQVDLVWRSILGHAAEYIDDWGPDELNHLAMQTYARYLMQIMRDRIENPDSDLPTMSIIGKLAGQ